MLWVSIAFAGTIGLGRAFDRERENDTLRALMLTPVPRLAIFLGKAFAIMLLVLAVAIVVSAVLALTMSVPLFDDPLALLLSLVLGCAGFATCSCP
jgi:heme exporter protein B